MISPEVRLILSCSLFCQAIFRGSLSVRGSGVASVWHPREPQHAGIRLTMQRPGAASVHHPERPRHAGLRDSLSPASSEGVSAWNYMATSVHHPERPRHAGFRDSLSLASRKGVSEGIEQPRPSSREPSAACKD